MQAGRTDSPPEPPDLRAHGKQGSKTRCTAVSKSYLGVFTSQVPSPTSHLQALERASAKPAGKVFLSRPRAGSGRAVACGTCSLPNPGSALRRGINGLREPGDTPSFREKGPGCSHRHRDLRAVLCPRPRSLSSTMTQGPGGWTTAATVAVTSRLCQPGAGTALQAQVPGPARGQGQDVHAPGSQGARLPPPPTS